MAIAPKRLARLESLRLLWVLQSVWQSSNGATKVQTHNQQYGHVYIYIHVYIIKYWCREPVLKYRLLTWI